LKKVKLPKRLRQVRRQERHNLFTYPAVASISVHICCTCLFSESLIQYPRPTISSLRAVLPKEKPRQADGGLKSLKGTDRNVCASRAWKGGNMKLVFGQHRFCDGAFLLPLVASFKPRRNFANSLSRSIFDPGGKYKENKHEDESDRTGCHSSCHNR
jgi:hypothetical protein